MTPDTLNQRFGSTDHINFSAGPGGLPMVTLRNTAATATVCLYGGQVLSYRPVDAGQDLLFLSEHAHYREGKAIKGGVPVCWPWFGADPEGLGRPAHGFVRTTTWTVDAAEEIDSAHTRLVLALGDNDASRALWPHAFSLTLTIDVGDTLVLTLATTNRGTQPFTITQALHTYFAIGDIGQVSVLGLDDTAYLDKPRGFATDRQSGPVRFDGEVDRVYQGVRHPLTIDDSSWQRRITIDAQNSTTAVVWNPGPAISAAMDDLADDAFERFVCVETANAGSETVTVAPGDSYSMQASYRGTAASPGE